MNPYGVIEYPYIYSLIYCIAVILWRNYHVC